jgi:hypothetical protein
MLFSALSWARITNSSPPSRAMMSEARNAKRTLENLGTTDQKCVASEMSERVVDALELVNVRKKKKEGIACAVGQLRILQTQKEKTAAVV